MEQWVALERSEAGVATVTLKATGRMPVISLQSGAALADCFESLAQDAQVRVVVLKGEGGHFCGGGDIAALRDSLSDPDRHLDAIIEAFHRCIRAMHAMPQPVIASVAGAAAGGGMSLAMACDLIVCAANARFVVGYPALGTSSDGGLSHTLTRRLGAMQAMDIILSRGALDAQAAQALGLVAKISEPEQLEAETAAYAERMAATPKQVLREFKGLITKAADDGLHAQLDAEKAAFLRCAKTPDFRERVDAFLSKKK
ncbi:enoyl-CoA hydratase/isomerase family protein [Sinimarinibacterium sp. CAU 1509]|uniref:enoyl-CoA hydratase/isomerase family protein n=1 Tax=Sinimarinibacterium sp. CAU 1509 TaxID=2562283 RepID=UPI001B7FB094|nr:enoyl-CoA hydratase-related protein [Sinimarinibacterium sp. CAU 1509]